MLDLSKLEALKLPEKEIEVQVMDETQKVKIRALDDETAIRVATIAQIPDKNMDLEVRREVIGHGVVGITDKQLDILMSSGAFSVSDLLVEIRDLTKEFSDERKQIRERAEKNLRTAAAGSTRP